VGNWVRPSMLSASLIAFTVSDHFHLSGIMISLQVSGLVEHLVRFVYANQVIFEEDLTLEYFGSL